MHVVRSASLRGFAELVTSLGGDPEAIVRRAGVPVEALRSDEILTPDDALARSMELAAHELDVADFGIRLSGYQDLSGLGPLAVAIRNSPTLGDAIDDARRFVQLHHQGSTMSIDSDPYGVRGVEGLRYVSALDSRNYPQASDNALLNLHRVVLLLADGEYGLRSVEMAYRPAAPLAVYEQAFGGVRINVEQPLTMLRLPSSARRRPISGAQTALRDVALYYLNTQPPQEGRATTVRARAVVEALMGSGRVGLVSVAASLELSTRTLQRRLDSEGTSLAGVIDAVRKDKAERLLADGVMTMADIAASLDFENQATLSRAARRWWGMTPSAKRRLLASPVL